MEKIFLGWPFVRQHFYQSSEHAVWYFVRTLTWWHNLALKLFEHGAEMLAKGDGDYRAVSNKANSPSLIFNFSTIPRGVLAYLDRTRNVNECYSFIIS